jgi:hypothetical protein
LSDVCSASSQEHSTRDDVKCFGMPPLQSELGLWAQKLVQEEYRLKRAAESKERRGEQTYIVDNSVLRGGTYGLAYRNTKHVDDVFLDTQGPLWGTEIDGADCGDGWLKVGEYYLPMVLHGMSVVAQQSNAAEDGSCGEGDTEPLLDGPALTEDGRVLELEEGGAIHFSSDPQCSPSHSSKLIMMKMMKAHQKAELARFAFDAEYDVVTEQVCSVDQNGMVRGATTVQTEKTSSAVERLKKIHTKRTRHQNKDTQITTAPVLCADAGGKVSAFLYLPNPAERRRRYQKKLHEAYGKEHKGTNITLSIDWHGIVRNFPTDEE